MANITVTLYWDMDLRKWTTTLGGTTETDPIQGLVQGDIVKFAVRFVQTGVAVVLAAPVFTASGIKADNDFTGSYLIQLSAPVLSDTTLYTFTVNPLNSANLNTFLQTYRNTWCALEIYDSVNGILTTPLELQITPGYSLSGTPTDNVAGVIVVAAGKTVTFPQSLTFPSALGTNGFQLSTDGAGALTWAASGGVTDGDKGDITVSASGATWTIDNDVITLAKRAHMATARVVGRTTAGTGTPELLTISGTGSVAMTNTPTLVTPVLGAATATSINGITITAGGSGTLTMAGGSINLGGTHPGSIQMSGHLGDVGGSITMNASGGSINTSDYGGSIDTRGELGLYGGSINTSCISGIFAGGSINTSSDQALGGSINTSEGGGSITTNGNGSIGLGIAANRITLVGTTASNGKTATFPNVTGTVAVAATSATATQALFATATAGAPAYRAIATADIATALTTPGAIGGTTASTGAFTTLTSSSTTDSTTTATGAIQTLGGLGVAKSIFAGGNINIPATTSTAGQITQASTRIFHTYGTENLFLGSSSGNFTTTGAGGNCGIGNLTLNLLQGGLRNMAIGSRALQKVAGGNDNIGIGQEAGNSITSGSTNTLVGGGAAGNLVSGSSNSVIGFQSMFYASGSSNVAVGVFSGYSVSSGSSNVLLGMNAGRAELGGAAITSGSFNTMLGDQTSAFLATGSYQTAIGAGAICTAINQVMIGRSTESVTLPGGLVTVPIAQTATTAAVSIAVTTTALTTTGVAQAITLANGTNGQIKIIAHIANGGTGTAVLTPATSAADYNTITFSSVGDTATLQYHTTGGWYILSLRGAVAA